MRTKITTEICFCCLGGEESERKGERVKSLAIAQETEKCGNEWRDFATEAGRENKRPEDRATER